eukprot:Transcript_2339.p2 GENE.Transcript_2339~~Transcript_2339.p2  ORF type:complete len:318 (-),score=151.09 Transcript_2339:24-977(-)
MLVIGQAGAPPSGGGGGGGGGAQLPPSDGADVWSMGCLLYEVLTGEYLFQEDDWTHFYLRVTSERLPLVTDAKLALVPAELREPVVDFLQSVLQRDPAKRPSIAEVAARFERLRLQLCPRSPRDALGVGATPRITPGRATPLAPTPRVPATAASASAALALSGGAAAAATPRGTPRDSGAAPPTVAAVALTPHVLLAPAALVLRPAALRALRVGLLVGCGVELPAAAAGGGGLRGVETRALPPLPLPDGALEDVEAAAAAVAREGRTTLLVGDHEFNGCCALAARLLTKGPDALPAFDACLRVRELCPSGKYTYSQM